MSAQSQSSPPTFPTHGMAFDGDVPDVSSLLPSITCGDPTEVARNHVHCSNSLGLPSTAHFHQLDAGEHPIPEYILSYTPYLWHANQAFCANMPLAMSTHVNQRMEHSLVWRPTNTVHMALQSLPAVSPPIVVNEMCDNEMTSVSRPPYYPGLYSTCWDSHAALDPRSTPWPNLPDRHLVVPIIKHHVQDEPGVHRPPSLSSHATPSHSQSALNEVSVSHPLVTNYFLSHQSFIPPSSHWYPLPMSTESLEPNPCPRFASPQESTTPSRRRRGARAIEYGGLWIDEEELLKGLTEPNGTLNVHQCHWEEDHTPCHLKIKGDKSSINAHIQKWHGGNPGEDKCKVECRWSSCRKTMLKESIARHILSVHLGETWECQGCGKAIARNDAYGQHAIRSNFGACRDAGALVTYSADVQVVDARAALDSGGRPRYAGA